MSTSTKLTKQYYKYSNIKYFRSKAENIELGSFGIKKDPIGQMAYLSVHNRVDAKHLVGRARYMHRAKIDWSDTTKAAWESAGAVDYYTVNGSGSATATFDRGRKAKLELVKFGLDAGDLIAMLNNAAGGARSFLSKEGKSARIVSEIFVVVEAEVAEAFASAGTSAGQVTAKLTKALGIEFEAAHAASTGADVSVVLSPGTTFAYGMHKVVDWNKGKIRKVEDDRKGMG